MVKILEVLRISVSPKVLSNIYKSNPNLTGSQAKNLADYIMENSHLAMLRSEPSNPKKKVWSGTLTRSPTTYGQSNIPLTKNKTYTEADSEKTQYLCPGPVGPKGRGWNFNINNVSDFMASGLGKIWKDKHTQQAQEYFDRESKAQEIVNQSAEDVDKNGNRYDIDE